MAERKSSKWKAGESGNPRGRPKGSGEAAKIRASIAAKVPKMLAALTKRALEGDVGAARLLLERAVPPLRAAEQAQPLNLPDGTLTEQAQAVLAAGNLAPGQGAALLGGIATLARVAEVDELAARIAKLEERHGKPETATWSPGDAGSRDRQPGG